MSEETKNFIADWKNKDWKFIKPYKWNIVERVVAYFFIALALVVLAPLAWFVFREYIKWLMFL